MNGRQLAEAALSLRSDLKVLFITGYAENAVINHGHLEPGMQIMTKPFQIEAAIAPLDMCLCHRQPRFCAAYQG
jgi:two-component SAPR family response regulator